MKLSTMFLWILVTGAMASGLFQLKYAVQEREDELARLNRDLIASKQAVHVLHAEWSYLSRPERIAELAARHLELTPMAPGQVASFDMLPMPMPMPMPMSVPTPVGESQ